ncbi:MAG: hypothetical protein ABI550_05015 [Ignavibacteriaceae bacterium]
MLVFPNNIFAKKIADNLPAELKNEIKYSPSALLTKEILKNKKIVGFIPTTDLINNKDFFVSKKFGISFEGTLCNSYIYFKPGKETIKEIDLAGDVSSLEVIVSKILFKEIYNSNIEVKLVADFKNINDSTYLLVGDKNFEDGLFKKGISFSEEMVELMFLPFVNYILVSKNENELKKIEENLLSIVPSIFNSFESDKLNENFSDGTKEFISSNISSLTLKLGEQDIEGIINLLQHPYFHGIIKNMIDVKFV